MESTFVSTTFPYCGTGCGFNLVVKDKKVVGVAPWNRNPVNEGKLCPTGNYAWEFVNNPDRLTTPLIKKDGTFVDACPICYCEDCTTKNPTYVTPGQLPFMVFVEEPEEHARLHNTGSNMIY